MNDDGARPRVLMVVEKLHGLGGAQKQALRLCRALGALGITSRIVTGRWRYAEPRRTEVDGVAVTGVFTAFKMFHIRGLRRLGNVVYLGSLLLHLALHRKRYDIIHVHSATVSALGVALAGRLLRKRTVMKVMASGGWSDFKRMREGGELPGARWMLGSLRRIDRVICLNEEAAAECGREGFPPEKQVRVPNGFPVREVVPRDGYPDGETVAVTFAGRLDGQKNPALLLEALALARGKPGGDRLRVRFLGSGPQRAELERMAGDLGLGGQARFLGRVDDVPAHLRETDIFVLPSLSEGVSNALLEAMAHGLPCVATAIPGNTDLIADRRTGILVGTSEPSQLAGALLELAGDRALRERLGRAARSAVERDFDMDAVAGRYAAMYRDLLALSPAGGRCYP